MFQRASRPAPQSAPAARPAPSAVRAAPVAATPRIGLAGLTIHPPRADRSGLPPKLRRGIEALSGMSMEGVKVHYRSHRPARIDALAYAQGREIHLAPGQDHHLPHEAWHIVQQAQGRVRPTMRTESGAAVNDDGALEREADLMGRRAAGGGPAGSSANRPVRPGRGAIQRAGLLQLAKAKTKTKAKRKAKAKKARPPEGWYGSRRQRTAFSYTSGTGNQGPHVVAHVAKRLMADRSVIANPSFDPGNIPERTGVIPSPGQARKQLRYYEEDTGIKIPLARKRKHDRQYRRILLKRRLATSPSMRRALTVKAMELSPIATYAHGRKVTAKEIAGKGENKKSVAPDLDLMEGLGKTGKLPAFSKIDIGEGTRKKHFRKLLRDTGTVSRGEEDLSELDTSSDEEYDDD